MTLRFLLSRRQFLSDAILSGLAMTTGDCANAATASAEIHVSDANGNDSTDGSTAHLGKPYPSASPRTELPLDEPGWRVLLDDKADWKNDELFAPGEVPPLDKLPARPPFGGWDTLQSQGVTCTTPACVEQLFAKGDPRFVYNGVSWFSREVNAPVDWRGKRVTLSIARAHLRVELFVNRRLAGYDLCCESNCAFDITNFLEPGKTNELAIRITNPGGSRGWDDTKQTQWGKNKLPSGRDFGGIDTVKLTATDPVHAENVFVMNRLPALGNRIQVIPTLANPTGKPAEAEFTAEILTTGGARLYSQSWKATIPAVGGEAPSPEFGVPAAKIWSIESPALHVCRLTIKAGTSEDRIDTRFGFRVLEVKPRNEDGKLSFFLNGKRFRHRSAIDFGFYAHSGFFGTPEQVRRSIQAAKDIGHNGINLHRHIGEYRVLDAADDMGLALYEEPGGLHQDQGGDPILRGSLADKVIQEKVRRMAVRDRNHPSLLIHNLSNEDNHWDDTREEAIRAIHRLNPTVFVCNASGNGGVEDGTEIDGKHAYHWSGPNRHFLPYGDKLLEKGFNDPHTVGARASFSEHTFASHAFDSKKDLFYYGEAFCYSGPANYWLLMEQAANESAAGSYDLDSSSQNHDEIADAFTRFHLAEIGSRLIQSPADVSRQAARALMYIDGRLSQRLMARDNVDGFAINGWSAHSYFTPPSCTPNNDAWDSAIVDAGRNLKGPAEDYAAWTKTAQIALFRKGPKFVKPGNTARFEVNLVNEARIPTGNYTLQFTVNDGVGRETEFVERRSLRVAGDAVFAQKAEDVSVVIKPSWHAGHLTLCATLKDAGGKVVAEGREQVLLQNRASWKDNLADAKVAVSGWPAAEAALKDAQVQPVAPADARVVVAGSIPADAIDLLETVKSGKTLIVKFDKAWADYLFGQGVLSKPVTTWGGKQTGESFGWFGNGWGYLDHFTGGQGFPSQTTLGTNGWEVPGDPIGFWPFESTQTLRAYGLHVARKSWDANGGIPTMLILIGAVDCGQGKVLLAPSYPVDDNEPLNDMLFFNMVLKAAKNDW